MNEVKEAQSLHYIIRKLKMDYKNAQKTNQGWEELHKSATSFFRELQTIERDLLGHDKEFLRNLDKMIDIYQQARERSTALKFDHLKDDGR